MAMVREKRGHPEWVPTEEEKEELLQASRNGFTHEEMAQLMGIGISTFQKKLNDYPDMRDAIEKGRGKAKNILANVAFEKARNGDNGCLFFLMERKYGYERTAKIQLSDTTQIDKDIKDKALETFKNDFKSDH